MAKLVKNLHEEKAEHIIIGGFCVREYDAKREPHDLDIWVNPKGDNPDRVTNALLETGFNFSDVFWNSENWAHEDGGATHLWHRRTGLQLDVLPYVSGSELFGGFDNAYRNSNVQVIGGQEYRFLNMHQLTINKIASWGEEREKDMNDARVLLTLERERTQEQAELEAFKREVDGLCERIFGPEKEREPASAEKTRRAAPETERKPEPTSTREPDRDRGHEW